MNWILNGMRPVLLKEYAKLPYGIRQKALALAHTEVDEHINERAALAARIAACAKNGKLLVVESGRDCDGVQYSGRKYTIDATAKAFHDLHNEIAEWADGPFRLTIVPFDTEVEYTSRDLVMEAYEDGHPHVIYSSF